MDATAVLEQARQRGFALRVDGDRLLYAPRHAAPPELVETLRQHKSELVALLKAQAMPPIPLPPTDPQAEAEEVARRVMENGVCLLWAEAVHDFLAFVRDDFPRAKVPPGFVVYTDSELKELFGDGKHPSLATLRFIHEAKKQGGKVAHD